MTFLVTAHGIPHVLHWLPTRSRMLSTKQMTMSLSRPMIYMHTDFDIDDA